MSSSSSETEDEKITEWGRILRIRGCPRNYAGVINEKLLLHAIRKNMNNSEVGNLMLTEDNSFDKVREIRIEFCKIIRIDHLWVLKNLEVLMLDNNYIDKIENLGSLVHLTVLDLSFNKISKIENLESLVNLEKLSFFDNSISTIENLGTLRKLTIFSIGRNKISDLKNIVYLRRLPKLKSLNMAENPCSINENFRYYVALFLPDLEYYEYKRISMAEKEIGNEMFSEDYAIMHHKEHEELGKKINRERQEEEAKLHEDSFVEYLNTDYLFESFYLNDPDGSALLLMGGEILIVHSTYQENTVRVCKDIFNMGQNYYKIRQDEIAAYRNSVNSIHQHSNAEAARHVDDFRQKKLSLISDLKQISKLRGDAKMDSREKIEEIITTFKELSHNTWKALMKLEIILYEQMMEINETYEHVLVDAINEFVEQSQEMFSIMRNVVRDYMEAAQEISQRYYATVVYEEEQAELEIKNLEEQYQITISKEISGNASNTALKNELMEKTIKEILREKVPVALKPYMKNKDSLINTLANSRDVHLQVVDSREDLLISRAKRWLNETIQVLSADEIQRNRQKVLEIANLIESEEDYFRTVIGEIRESILDLTYFVKDNIESNASKMEDQSRE